MKYTIKEILFYIIIVFCGVCAFAIRLDWENQRIDKRIELRESK